MANNKNNRKMSLGEAGKKGGDKMAREHDSEYFEEIGKKGGQATSKNHDQEFYEEIGQKGGEKRARQRKNNNDNQ